MAALRREDGFGGEADRFYEALMRAHAGLDDEESGALDARLVLVLANQIGDLGVLTEALRAARATIRPADLAGATGPDGPTGPDGSESA